MWRKSTGLLVIDGTVKRVHKSSLPSAQINIHHRLWVKNTTSNSGQFCKNSWSLFVQIAVFTVHHREWQDAAACILLKKTCSYWCTANNLFPQWNKVYIRGNMNICNGCACLHANMEHSSSSAKVSFVLTLFMKYMDHFFSWNGHWHILCIVITGWPQTCISKVEHCHHTRFINY